MRPGPTVETERLLLRPWREDDRLPFASLNADPRVMEYFPSLLTKEESDATVERIFAHIDTHGFGLWAVEVPGRAPYIGFVGLMIPSWQSHFTPCVEVGWRLAQPHWGEGYAPEAARAALRFGFEELDLPEIVSLTVPANRKSRRVMEKIGMHHDEGGDFDHPMLPRGHAQERHVLYRLAGAQWRSLAEAGRSIERQS